jgi:NhaP-type Na+/H+ or K+/H+ antiporter
VDRFVTDVALIGLVLIAGSLLSGTLERIGIPIVLAFLVVGALLGPFGLGLVDVGFNTPALHVLATLGLVLVLFTDAVTIKIPQLRRHARLLWRVLGPGTILPAVVIALAAGLLLHLPAAGAAIVGAALASTDPVLLRAAIRSGALPPQVRLSLSIETGMNDIVLLPIVILAILASVGPLNGHDVERNILGLFGLGPLLGALVGWIGILALSRVRSRVGVRRDYESLYALGLAFSAFAAAEAVGGSGFVAAFVAGAVIAAVDVELCDCFLEYGEATAEMLLLLTFVALGGSLIWLGLQIIDWRLVLFAVLALTARTVILYPMLAGVGMAPRDRRIASLFGARGLSSLLLVLLPVFAGVPGAERLFQITAFVVLLSIVLHGGGIALFLRRHRPTPSTPSPTPAPVLSEVPERITIQELRELQSHGDEVIVVDARASRNYDTDAVTAAGAARLNPEDPVRDARALRLSQRATLVIYCA